MPAAGGRYGRSVIEGSPANPRNAAGGTSHVTVYVTYPDSSARTLHGSTPLLPFHRQTVMRHGSPRCNR